MGWQNALSGLGKGALWGGIGGAVLGTLTFGPFGTIAGAIAGAKIGGVTGGVIGAFKPDYQQIQTVYNPNVYQGVPQQNYGGMQMPNTLFGNSPVMTTTVPTSGGDGWKMAGAAVAGAALSSMVMPGMGYGMGYGYGFGMPMYGMGYGSSLGLGPFNWNVW